MDRHSLEASGADTAQRTSTCLDGVELVAMRSAHCFPRHAHDEYGIGLIADLPDAAQRRQETLPIDVEEPLMTHYQRTR